MSKRAMYRRKAKEEKRNKATFVLTKEQLDKKVEDEFNARIDDIRDELYSIAARDMFILMMAFPLQVLREKYWKKSFPTRVQGFVNEVINLYDSWQNGEIDVEDIKKDLWEYGGVRLERK